MRAQICVLRDSRLRFGQKEERANRLVEIEGQIARIFGDAYDFVLAAGSDAVAAEVLSDRIFILEKLPRKRLIDDCHVPRSRRILLGDAAPSDDRISDDVKVSRCDSIPGSRVVVLGSGSGMPIHPDASCPNRCRSAASTGREPLKIRRECSIANRGCAGRAA